MQLFKEQRGCSGLSPRSPVTIIATIGEPSIDNRTNSSTIYGVSLALFVHIAQIWCLAPFSGELTQGFGAVAV